MIIPILSIALLLLSFLCKKDKGVFYILWVFVTIIIVLNTYNIDWDAYEFMYGVINTIEKSSLTDIGYGFLNFVANRHLHLSFFQFRAVFTLVGMFLVKHVIINNAPCPALVLALYFIAPFFPNDIIQIRNFIAQAILAFFLTKWIDSGNKNMIYFILGIGLATTMHVSTIYFVVFALLYFFKDERKLYIAVGIGTLLVGVLPVILGKISFISSEKISFYLGSISQGIDIRGIIIIIAFVVQLYLLYIIRNYSFNTSSFKFKKWADTVYKMNILCLPACAIMTVWSFNFYRVPRNMLLLNYIVYAMYLNERKDKKLFHFSTIVFVLMGVCWSALNSFSQWSVIWNNNALIRW